MYTWNGLHQKHIETLRQLAKDERIWEFTKAFSIDETFDKTVRRIHQHSI